MIKNLIGVKLCGLSLVFFTIFGLSFVVSSDVNALQHSYVGIPLTSPYVPLPSYSGDSYFLDFTQSATLNNSTSVGIPFELKFEGDASVNLNNYNILYSSSYFDPYLVDNQCSYNGGSIFPTFSFGEDFVASNLPSYFPERWSSFSGDAKCRRLQQFGQGSVPVFSSSSRPTGVLSCNKSNGAVCNGLWNANDYLNGEILPYWFSNSDLSLLSKAVDTDGIHYSSSFSLSDIFGQTVPRFSFMQVPLWDIDSDYFYTSSNFYNGRHFEFKGAFEFDGSFSWHSNIQNNGSYFRVILDGFSAVDGEAVNIQVNCSTNLITLDNLTRLEYTCPVTLNEDLLMMFPYLEISGNGNYVFETDANWRFAYTFLTTDFDDTPGQDFNSSHVGGGSKQFGDASNNISSGTPDWIGSLQGLFNFVFINPFAPLFSMFTDNASCASIPTIAGMIHSDSTSVCPWFDSTTRAIVTPVLSIASMMLVFGFAVRWLGSSSGNLFEDTGGVDSGNLHFGSKYRRNK